MIAVPDDTGAPVAADTAGELLGGWDAAQARKPQKRSMTIAGHRTSISLEEPFWRGLLDWIRERLVSEGMIDAADMDLVQVHNEPEQVVETIFRHYENRAFIPSPAERETFLNL